MYDDPGEVHPFWPANGTDLEIDNWYARDMSIWSLDLTLAGRERAPVYEWNRYKMAGGSYGGRDFGIFDADGGML